MRYQLAEFGAVERTPAKSSPEIVVYGDVVIGDVVPRHARSKLAKFQAV